MSAEEPEAQVIHALLHEEGRFFAFIRSRVGSIEAAEDILQSAYVRGLQKGHQVRDDQSIVAWFYALLRNALIDHYRSSGASKPVQPEPDWWDTLESGEDLELLMSSQGCVRVAMRALRPEDAQLVEGVDLEGRSIHDMAQQLGITPNALSLRLLRARQSLRTNLQHLCSTCTVTKCLYCRCEPGGNPPL